MPHFKHLSSFLFVLASLKHNTCRNFWKLRQLIILLMRGQILSSLHNWKTFSFLGLPTYNYQSNDFFLFSYHIFPSNNPCLTACLPFIYLRTMSIKVWIWKNIRTWKIQVLVVKNCVNVFVLTNRQEYRISFVYRNILLGHSLLNLKNFI